MSTPQVNDSEVIRDLVTQGILHATTGKILIAALTFPGGATFLRADGEFAAPAAVAALSVTGDITMADGKAIKPDTTTAHTAVLQAYDVNDAAYRTFLTLTNGNVPKLTLSQPAGGLLVIIPPTVDPAVAGAIWNNAGTLAIS